MQRRALASVCAVLFLTFLDNTVISVALADVQTTLHPGIQALQWVVDAYMLAFAALMLTGGTLGDLFGRRRVMLAGVAVFCAGSLLAALARGSDMLIAGRVVMGVGAAASEPGTLSVLRHVFPDRTARARAIGAWTAVSGAALAFGPIIGGLIVGASGWRGVFWFNLAFGAVALLAAATTVPESSDRQGRRLDLGGMALGAATLTAAAFAIIEGEIVGYGVWWIDLLFASAAAGAVGFVAFERRTPDPVLDLRAFGNRAFANATAVAFLANWGVFAVFFFTAFYLELIGHFAPAKIALQFVAMAVAMWVAAALASWWTARAGPRLAMVAGCGLGGAGLLLVASVLSPNVSVATLAWALAIAGLGFGAVFVAMTAAALSGVPAERSGMAASVVNASRELGGVFGVAILGALLNREITDSLAHRLAALGIPANFRAVVISTVTHGGVPKSAGEVSSGLASGHAKLVDQVIHAAENAFASGLHLSLLIAATMLLLAAAASLARARGPATTVVRRRPGPGMARPGLRAHR